MKHRELFEWYQTQLAWVDRRREPKTLEFHGETAESWKHAKEIIFSAYEHFRYYTDDGLPNYEECFDYKDKLIKTYKPYQDKFPCIGILKYRDQKWPIYNDDYGCQEFIVMEEGYHIPICNMGGSLDWYYELDKIIDKIYE